LIGPTTKWGSMVRCAEITVPQKGVEGRGRSGPETAT
jgi:hypothetical protein